MEKDNFSLGLKSWKMALQHSAPVRPMWSLSVFLNSSAVASTRHEACDMKSSLNENCLMKNYVENHVVVFFSASPRLIWFSARMIMISRWICWLHCSDMSPSFSVQFLPQKYSFCFAVERSLSLTTKVVFPPSLQPMDAKKGIHRIYMWMADEEKWWKDTSTMASWSHPNPKNERQKQHNQFTIFHTKNFFLWSSRRKSLRLWWGDENLRIQFRKLFYGCFAISFQ